MPKSDEREAGDSLPDPGQPKPGGGLVKTIKLELGGAADEAVGQTLGRYKLLEKVGEGGCGVVYVAEQTEPVRRRVALKVIKLGMDTKAVVARFEAERQALAMMDHPNIAKVLDAGATEQGRPYFVMELVRGIPITDYCDQNNLTTGERLDLFIKVCQAIQHAHQKGIIHRDIKPSNILVTLHDGAPVPKVIDFGIAKATEGRLTDNTVYTQLHQFIGTPAYMSPEQAEMSGLDIDTRSDLYSLGVLLYELLTGRTPFDADELVSQGIDAMRKTIREREPLRPSTKVATLKGEDRTTTAKRRSSDAAKLLHQLKGDLDWIVMKCLEKDRTRRYDTVNGLALDLKRHLDNEPVLARPPSTAYKFQKFLRRNKVSFAAAAVVVVALVLGIIATTVQTQRALRAKEDAVAARHEAETAEKAARTEAAKQAAVNNFLNQMFAAADPDALSAPNQAKEAAGTVVDMLDAAAKQLDGGELKGRPEIEAVIRQTLGQTYESRGQYAAADQQLSRALELDKQVDGPDSLNTARTLSALAHLRLSQDNLAEADQLQTEELAIQRKLHGGKEDPEVARALYDLANIHLETALGSASHLDHQKLVDAEAAFREALAMQRRLLPAKDRNIAKTLTILGRVLIYEDKLAESESLLNEALAMQKDVLGPEHPDVAFTMQQLGENLEHQKRFSEAEDLCRQAIAIQRKALGNDHPALATSLLRLGFILIDEGRPADAEVPVREALAIRRNALGENNIHVAWCLKTLAECLAVQKKWPEAEDIYRDQLTVWAKARGMDSEGYQTAVKGLVDALKSEGKFSDAEEFLNQTLAEERASLGRQNPLVAQTLSDLGDLLAAQNQPAEADRKYKEELDILLNGDTTNYSNAPELAKKLAAHFVDANEFRDAEQLYEQTIKVAQDKLGPSDSVLGQLCYDYGHVLREEEKYDAAAEHFLRAVQICRANKGSDLLDDRLRTAGFALVYVRKFKEAEAYLQEAIAVYRASNQQDAFWGVAFPNSGLARALYCQQKLPEAEKAIRDSLASVAGVDTSKNYPRIYRSIVMTDLARLLRRENKGAEADAIENDLLSHESAFYTAAQLIHDADFWKTLNRPDDAAWNMSEAAAIMQKARADDSTNLPSRIIFPLLEAGYKQQVTNTCRRMLDSPTPDANWLANASGFLSLAHDPTNRDPALAIELAKKFIALEPNKSWGWTLMGAALYRSGDYKEAVADLEKGAQSGYEGATAQFFLAMASHRLGDDNAARKSYSQGAQWMAEHNPDDSELVHLRAEAEELINPPSEARLQTPNPSDAKNR